MRAESQATEAESSWSSSLGRIVVGAKVVPVYYFTTVRLGSGSRVENVLRQEPMCKEKVENSCK